MADGGEDGVVGIAGAMGEGGLFDSQSYQGGYPTHHGNSRRSAREQTP